MSYKFWRRVREWAKGKAREKFLHERCVNLMCPHCNTWQSDADGEQRIRSFGHPIAVAMDCGQCGKSSAWVCEAGFWFSAKEFLGQEVTDIPPSPVQNTSYHTSANPI